jgi:hypothetical protein
MLSRVVLQSFGLQTCMMQSFSALPVVSKCISRSQERRLCKRIQIEIVLLRARGTHTSKSVSGDGHDRDLRSSDVRKWQMRIWNSWGELVIC